MSGHFERSDDETLSSQFNQLQRVAGSNRIISQHCRIYPRDSIPCSIIASLVFSGAAVGTANPAQNSVPVVIAELHSLKLILGICGGNFLQAITARLNAIQHPFVANVLEVLALFIRKLTSASRSYG